MSDQSIAQSIHERLLAALDAMRKAESQAVTLFAEVLKGKLYRGLGYASIHLYAEEALGFSRSKTYEFIRLAEALESLLALSTRVDKVKSPYQVVVQKCPACKEKTVGPERCQLSPAESAQIDCDSSVLETGQRNKASIPPARRRTVLARDAHRCQTKGCRSTSFLEVHHIKSRSRGGDNREENLITLCASCHRHLHERSDSLAVKAGLGMQRG